MPTETLSDPSDHVSASGWWGVCLQILLVAGAFVGAWVCLRNCGEIPAFEARYREELGGKPLPPITEWLLQYRTIFMFAAIFAPLAALGTFALRERSQACFVLLALGLAVGFEAFVVHEALRMPFIQIFKLMGGAAGG